MAVYGFQPVLANIDTPEAEMSREHDVVTLSGAEYDALLSEAEEAARLREELAALRAALAAEPGYWQDKAEGLEADLDSALDIIFRRGDQGAREWLAMNYPGKFPAAPTEARR